MVRSVFQVKVLVDFPWEDLDLIAGYHPILVFVQCIQCILYIYQTVDIKVIMQGKLFQRCTHLLYCSVLSKPDMGSIFHIKNQRNILVIGNYYMNYQNCQNLMLLTFSDTKGTLMYLFLFTNPPRENCFQYARRVYATAINSCIITLVDMLFFFLSLDPGFSCFPLFLWSFCLLL